MGRQPCCEKIGLKQGPWTAEEDKKLRDFINTNGTAYSWKVVPKFAELLRCGKSCRLRWANYLRPNLKNDRLSEEDEELVIRLHSEVGNKWSTIASHLPGRTDNYIKNYWHNHLKKLLIQKGIDPVTHKPLLTHPPAVHSRKYKSQKRAGKSRDEIKDQGIAETPSPENIIIPSNNNYNNNNHQLGMESLIIDAEFSVEEIPVINSQEILVIPHLSVDEIPSNAQSSPSSHSTQLTASTRGALNRVAHGWHHNNHVQCRNYIENPSCSNLNNADDLDYWLDLLTRDFDIQKIDPKMLIQPPATHDSSHH